MSTQGSRKLLGIGSRLYVFVDFFEPVLLIFHLAYALELQGAKVEVRPTRVESNITHSLIISY